MSASIPIHHHPVVYRRWCWGLGQRMTSTPVPHCMPVPLCITKLTEFILVVLCCLSGAWVKAYVLICNAYVLVYIHL